MVGLGPSNAVLVTHGVKVLRSSLDSLFSMFIEEIDLTLENSKRLFSFVVR